MKELLYREHFQLSARQMAKEPAEAVEYWLIVQGEREAHQDALRKREARDTRRHTRR